MKVYYSTRYLPAYPKPVAAVGMFDGLHLAHQRLIASVRQQAASVGGTSMVITFDPHPQKESSICSLPHRLWLMQELGIQVCIVVRFDRRLARLDADDFVRDYMVRQIGVFMVIVGEDFRFGYRQTADVTALTALAGRYGFTIRVQPLVRLGAYKVSSTRLREAIVAGDLACARRMLGGPVRIRGMVIRGAGRSTRLGFPTANIDTLHEIIPPFGIYAVRVILEGSCYDGVCFIGAGGQAPRYRCVSQKNPESRRVTIEVHIFRFRRNIYDKELEICFFEKIRDPRNFHSTEMLIKQIKEDALRAKFILSRHQ